MTRLPPPSRPNSIKPKTTTEPEDDYNEFLFDGLDIALTDAFIAAMSQFLFALERGERHFVDQAMERLRTSLAICSELNMLPQWWAHRIAIHLLSDFWSNTFHEMVPLQPAGGDAGNWSQLRELFIAVLHQRPKAEVDLWPSQIEAASRAVDQSDDLVVSLPTSAGKTRIAELCILRCLAGGNALSSSRHFVRFRRRRKGPCRGLLVRSVRRSRRFMAASE